MCNQGNDNKFLRMSANELSKTLSEYARERRGEIADITYAASVMIAVLAAKVSTLEDDGK